MLRFAKTLMNRPTLYAGSVTVGASTVTVDRGLNDIRSATRPLAGAASFSWKNPFNYRATDITQSAVHICTPIRPSDFNLRGQIYTSDPSAPTIKNANGNDGALEVVAFGSRSYDARGITIPQVVGSSNIAPRVIWGKVSSAGAVTIGNTDFVVQKTGTGIYTVNFRRAFGNIPTIIVQGTQASAPSVGLESKTAAGCIVRTANISYSATDGEFYIAAFGGDSREDEGGYVDRPLQSSQRKPIIIGMTIDAGIRLGFGSQFASWAGGAGANVLTYTKPLFAREPAIFATYHGTAANKATIASSSTATIGAVQTVDAAGAGEALSASVLVIGSGDVAEY